MGEPQNHHFYDFGIFERVPAPQNQLSLSLETPGHLKQIKKNPWGIQTYYFRKFCFFGNQHLGNFGTDGHRQIPPIHLITT